MSSHFLQEGDEIENCFGFVASRAKQRSRCPSPYRKPSTASPRLGPHSQLSKWPQDVIMPDDYSRLTGRFATVPADTDTRLPLQTAPCPLPSIDCRKLARSTDRSKETSASNSVNAAPPPLLT